MVNQSWNGWLIGGDTCRENLHSHSLGLSGSRALQAGKIYLGDGLKMAFGNPVINWIIGNQIGIFVIELVTNWLVFNLVIGKWINNQ